MSSAPVRPRAEADSPADCFLFENGALSPCSRDLLPEEPLGIVLDGEPVVTLMRTPGHEEDLALGFLLTEGLIRSAADVGAISFCREGLGGGGISKDSSFRRPSMAAESIKSLMYGGPGGAGNEVRAHRASRAAPARPIPAHRRVYSSCGICGADMIKEAATDIPPFHPLAGRIAPEDLFKLGDAMKAAQELFRRTGAAHGAALALPSAHSTPLRAALSKAERAAPEDSRVLVREDIGRHNALDKAVGAAARQGISLSGSLLLLSGRLSFEMVAKAARVGISDVAAVSAPSALAVTLARTLNMFLAGFVRNRTMTVYSGADALRSAGDRPS